MSDYSCDKCGKLFGKISNYNRHINRKTPCIKIEQKNYICFYCDMSFTNTKNRKRHMMKSCKAAKESIRNKTHEELMEIFIQLMEEREKSANVKNPITGTPINTIGNSSDSHNMTAHSHNTNTNNNIINKNHINKTNNNHINNGTINNNITLVKFGMEDASILTDKEILHVLSKGFYSTVHLAEMMHFNKKYPQFQNVFIPSTKEKFAMVYDGKTWSLRNKNEIVEEMYSDKKDIIEEKLDLFYDQLSDSKKASLARWLETPEDDKGINRIKCDMMLLLINKRKLPQERMNKMIASGMCPKLV